MPNKNEAEKWLDLLRKRYESYLRESFYFKDVSLRDSFAHALGKEDLTRGLFPETGKNYAASPNSARELAGEFFDDPQKLVSALLDSKLYAHQEKAIRQSHGDKSNIVVATGTASGKTESFLYPIFFELFKQYQEEKLSDPGVRALILYPMNALANDQRERLGKICQELKEHSGFELTFGQYIGETPKDENDDKRNASQRKAERQPGELVFRKEMRDTPPHILLTNYSMLEYLLLRPVDSQLFDNGRGKFWEFIVLDEAHQYRGTKGMEMAMLIRRLKQRIRDGGRDNGSFRCIATSATISSQEDSESKEKIAKFATGLFDEKFSSSNIIFAEYDNTRQDADPVRHHAFMRALEGAFLINQDGKDKVILNRADVEGDSSLTPLEIALCHECGQHYYVGRELGGKLVEAIRDPSHDAFGVGYYLPLEGCDDSAEYYLCKSCGGISCSKLHCHPSAIIKVRRCDNHDEHKDRLKECGECGYKHNDPVREVVHGSDGPNTVIATVLHEKQCNENNEQSRTLAFADSRQEASFFAWYAEDSFNKIRDRNFIWRALSEEDVDKEGLSIDDLQRRLEKICQNNNFFGSGVTNEGKKTLTLAMIYKELLTDEKRISLQGVGLVRWHIKFPSDFQVPAEFSAAPWGLSNHDAKKLIEELLMDICFQGAVKLIEGRGQPRWGDIHLHGSKPKAFFGRREGKHAWSSGRRHIVKHYLTRFLESASLSNVERLEKAQELMDSIWDACIRCGDDSILAEENRGNGRLVDLKWLRISPKNEDVSLYECDTCARVYFRSIKDICPRNGCSGNLGEIKEAGYNHYANLYKSLNFPVTLSSEEHTAQIKSDEARKRQKEFKEGKINLLSSSTTFEVGVDLGELETVFMRNVPPEPFNYTQRAGRAGRREMPGFVLTYCRRNPHDLYHYENPDQRILHGEIHPPILHLKNQKIILRHIMATVLSLFFRSNPERFGKVKNLVSDWSGENATNAVFDFCRQCNDLLVKALSRIVPSDMLFLLEDPNKENWIERIAGKSSKLAESEREVCEDYRLLESEEEKASREKCHDKAGRIRRRIETIKKEDTISFLSRKTIIPKYGFPVDVVELDTWGEAKGVVLQRDLSQAIAEYAPGGKVVANKREWESVGVKTVPGQEFLIYSYQKTDPSRKFEWALDERFDHKCIVPKFGFVTNFDAKPKSPQGKAQRLFTTRPYFAGFHNKESRQDKEFRGIKLSKATPGKMVVLCEGKEGKGFHFCQSCYAGYATRKTSHKKPDGNQCNGTLRKLSLGHDFVTDVVRIQFPGLKGQWDAYSLAYALLLGASQALQLPMNDLSTTITGSDDSDNYAIILYDNVPGGAGLVANLHDENIFKKVLENAYDRMKGGCGCSFSCYGCLRSYQNQFAHPELDRKKALDILSIYVDNS